MTVSDYQALVTSAFAQQPNFQATLAVLVSPLVQIQDLLTAMRTTAFDLDIAVGTQLDAIGAWVGVSRDITTPVTGVFFAWDGDASVGWDYGIWFSSTEPGAVTVLPDDVYRTLIRARIAANHWDGTTEGAYVISAAVFPNLEILIQDNQDMSMRLIILGGPVDSLTLALIQGGYIPLKPEGVRVSEYVIGPVTGPLFAWDVETDYLAGWDEGSWGLELTPT